MSVADNGPQIIGQIIGQSDAATIPRYAGLSTFARLPRREDVSRYDVAVLGIPFDSGTSYRPGARFGPAHVRQSSRLLRPYNPTLQVAPFGALQVVDAGDVPCNPFDIDLSLKQIEDQADELRGEGARILSIVPVEAEPEPAQPRGGAGDDAAALDRFHEILDARRRITSAQASLAESIAVVGEDLVLRFGIDKAAAKESLEEPATRKLLAEVAREAFGRPLRIVLKTGPPADGDLGQAAREVPRESLSRERASNKAETDPVVRSALELFRGELTEVKEEE